jgi:hypothetical protein
MKAYVDLTINGHAVAVEVDYSYDVDPDPLVTTVTLGNTEIIHALDDHDMRHLNWCAERDWERSGHNPNRSVYG